MKLSRVAVVLASAAAVIAPAVPAGAVTVQAAGAVTSAPMIFDDPFGFAAQFIDNPRSVTLIFETPFD